MSVRGGVVSSERKRERERERKREREKERKRERGIYIYQQSSPHLPQEQLLTHGLHPPPRMRSDYDSDRH